MQFNGDNTYPDCQKCGRCCKINVLCMTADDYRTIQRFVEEHDISPIDYGGLRCCFQNDDCTCMIWSARPQVCRLHNCQIPRRDVLAMDPTIVVDEDLWLVDLHANFVAQQSNAAT